jgi:hypothetical protein
MSTKNKMSTKIGRPRKEETKVYSKRVPLSIYLTIKENVDKYIDKIISNGFIVDSNITSQNDKDNSIDTQILKKMIRPFAERNMEVKLTEEEKLRIKKIFFRNNPEISEKLDE